MTLFSVIVPTYNRLNFLEATLGSVLSQVYKDYEVIVVDDGSTDGTREYLETLGPAIKFWVQSNNGPSRARNVGAQQASGQYLAFLDSDDLWFPWTLDIYAKVILNSVHPAFIAGKPRCFESQEMLSIVNEEVPTWQKFSDYLASHDEWRWFGVSSFVVERRSFMRAGGFSEELQNGEDADLALRLGTESGFVQITAPYTFGYRQHSGNIAHDLEGSVCALRRAISRENLGEYPGGSRRKRHRRQILTRHIRPVALACAQTSMMREAWELYWSTFAWHLDLGKWRFLGAFPFVVLIQLIRRR